MFYVYKITNKLNSKVYIGKATDALKRFRIHIKIAKGGKEKYPRKFHAIHAAIVKYGIENFTFEILHEVLTEQEAFALEIQEIKLWKLNNFPCYNLSGGGEGNSGWKHTDETRKKMSISRKGKRFSNEHKQALSQAQSGSNHSQFGKHQTTKWKEGKSKLTAQQVQEIKQLLLMRVKQKIIAAQYDVSVPTISLIKSGKIWSEITSLQKYQLQADQTQLVQSTEA
jgi:group I intron endonuclease